MDFFKEYAKKIIKQVLEQKQADYELYMMKEIEKQRKIFFIMAYQIRDKKKYEKSDKFSDDFSDEKQA